MKKALIFGIFAALLSATVLTSCQQETHTHTYSAWHVKQSATCLTNGLQERTCSCGNLQSEIIPATGHSFGSWIMDGEKQQYQVCIHCNYREVQYFSSQDENTQAPTDIFDNTDIVGSYPNFDIFQKACQTISTNELLYKGDRNQIEVNLSDGSLTCDNYTIHIPARVTDIKFIGNVQGTPFQNVKIVVDDRQTDINMSFENIDIESNDSIIESATFNINVKLTMLGTKCRFVVTQKAADGANGKNKGFDAYLTEAQNGERGANGAPAMYINGTCKVVCAAKSLIIRGGDGGNGGNGGSVPNIIGLFGNGGNGGDGGDGGDGIMGETLATVEVLSDDCIVSISGGVGGLGGYGGTDHGIDVHPGSNGNPGNNGISGCVGY